MKNNGLRILALFISALIVSASVISCATVTDITDETDAFEGSDTESGGDTEMFSDIPLSDLIITADNNIEGVVYKNRDVFADTWVAVDGANRSTPDPESTKAPTGQEVGIFYYLWRDREQDSVSNIPPSDHYAAYLEGGTEKLKEVMQEGGEGHPHYWAEPYFGYYSSNDEWVLRRHAYMLSEAGVDFVFFDTTNNNLHTTSFMALMKVWTEMQNEGVNVPKVCFLCGAYDAEFNQLWETVYKQGLYENLWYYWDGKPVVMLAGDVNMTKEQEEFFTVRYSWAVKASNWYTERKGLCCWPWASEHRQWLGYGETKKDVEQCVVMCGFWATNGVTGNVAGRSYSNKSMPKVSGSWDFGFPLTDTTSGLGLAFAEQFEYAIGEDTPMIMITGWNEWIAGRWSGAGAGAAGQGQILAGEYKVTSNPDSYTSTYFVDQFNPEFSRDIEPMKGGFGDNYLYQMAEYIRKYKGSRFVESAFGQNDMRTAPASESAWAEVGPEYRDYSGDTTERISPGHVGGSEYGMYVNFSGRNDIVTAKVSACDTNVSFFVCCAEDITEPEGSSWMNLFINTDRDDKTGWYGYDILINRAQKGNLCSVERFVGTDEWRLESVGAAEYERSGKALVITVDSSVLELRDEFEFKWADNSLPTHDIMEFLDMGDAAPNGRYNYLYTNEKNDVKLPEGLTDDMTVLKSGSYNAIVNSTSVRLNGNDTRATAIVSGTEVFIPLDFASTLFDYGFDTVYTHNGVKYVKVNEAVQNIGKYLTVTDYGLILISSDPVEDVFLQRALYRALT